VYVYKYERARSQSIFDVVLLFIYIAQILHVFCSVINKAMMTMTASDLENKFMPMPHASCLGCRSVGRVHFKFHFEPELPDSSIYLCPASIRGVPRSRLAASRFAY